MGCPLRILHTTIKLIKAVGSALFQWPVVNVKTPKMGVLCELRLQSNFQEQKVLVNAQIINDNHMMGKMQP